MIRFEGWKPQVDGELRHEKDHEHKPRVGKGSKYLQRNG
jgi:hypothetical protein